MLNNQASKKPLIAYLEDDKIFRRFAARMIPDADVLVFGSPEEFLLKIEENSSFIATLDLILTDQNFDHLSEMTGLDLGGILKKRYEVTTPIIIFSNDEFTQDEIKDRANSFIPKQFIPFKEMINLVKNV